MSGQGVQKTVQAEEQRQSAWELIVGREGFTAAEIAQETGMSEPWARKVVREWHSAGLIAPALQDGQTTIWRTVEVEEAVESAYARESKRPEFAMWRTMRELRRFKAEDVLLTANTDRMPLTLPEVQKYCSTLAEAGFLKVAVKGRAGFRAPIYAMQGRPGPFPPRLMRVPAVYDPNTAAFRILEKRVRP